MAFLSTTYQIDQAKGGDGEPLYRNLKAGWRTDEIVK